MMLWTVVSDDKESRRMFLDIQAHCIMHIDTTLPVHISVVMPMLFDIAVYKFTAKYFMPECL